MTTTTPETTEASTCTKKCLDIHAIKQYLPHIGIGLREILEFKKKDQEQVLALLTNILEKERK